MKVDCRRARSSVRTFVLPFAVLALIAGMLAPFPGCSGNGLVPFAELLFVNDRWTIHSYAVDGGSATLKDSEEIPGLPGTYARVGNLVTVTMQKHRVPDGYRVKLDFLSGNGGVATDGTYVATFVDDDTFTIVDPASGGITNGTLLRSFAISFQATYSQTGTTVTISFTDHRLEVDDGVILDYTSGSAVDDDVTIATVVDANTFTVTSDAPATTSGNVTVTVGGNYSIFDIAMHPSGRWIYVTSTFDCFNGSPYCWAGDLISRFAIDWDDGNLTFEQSYRTTDDPSAITSRPSPVTLVFSADGTRLVHQDDDLDGLRLWDVNPSNGDLTLVASSAPNTTGQHGIALSADATRAYHGNGVFSIGPASITSLVGGMPGEANQIVGGTMFALIPGMGSWNIRAFSLANPDLPAQIAASPATPNQARDLAVMNGGALIVASGFGGLKSYTFNGVAIAPAVGAGSTELIDGPMFPPIPPGAPVKVYRMISPNAAGNLVAAAYFTNDPDAGTGGIPPSGFILANVAADGSLSLAGDFPGAYYARVARFFQRP